VAGCMMTQAYTSNSCPPPTLGLCSFCHQASRPGRFHWLFRLSAPLALDGTASLTVYLVTPLSFPQVSDRELYDKIMAGAAPGSGHAAFVGERAELLLSQPARLGLRTK
jgi:hypothetical protein